MKLKFELFAIFYSWVFECHSLHTGVIDAGEQKLRAGGLKPAPHTHHSWSWHMENQFAPKCKNNLAAGGVETYTGGDWQPDSACMSPDFNGECAREEGVLVDLKKVVWCSGCPMPSASQGNSLCNGTYGAASGFSTLFDRAFVINLKRRPMRRIWMNTILNTVGVPATKVSFYDAFDVHEWGTQAFNQGLADTFKQPANTITDRSIMGDCCWARLNDSSVNCDVSGCGLWSSSLSHLGAMRTWLDKHPSEQSLMIFEDDIGVSIEFFNAATMKRMKSPPEGWKLLKFGDCVGKFHQPKDPTCNVNEDRTCNDWRRIEDVRYMSRGSVCISAYMVSRYAVEELFRWHQEEGSIFAHLAERGGDGQCMTESSPSSPAEYLFNLLIYGPWSSTSYQMLLNPFSQEGNGDMLNAKSQTWDSDNHPDSYVLGGRSSMNTRQHLTELCPP